MMESKVHILEFDTGARLRDLRTASGMTLEELAIASGVSRAMISRTERGEASPTAALLARLATALGHSLSTFFAVDQPADPFNPFDRQHVWKDPDTGYLRRAVSPPGTGSAIDIVDVVLPPGKRVSFPPQASSRGIVQHVWVLDGVLSMELQGTVRELRTGDCLFHDIGLGHSFINPGRTPVRYAVVLENRRK